MRDDARRRPGATRRPSAKQRDARRAHRPARRRSAAASTPRTRVGQQAAPDERRRRTSARPSRYARARRHVPSTPCPATTCTSLGTRLRDAWRAASRNACAIGCSDCRPRAPRRAPAHVVALASPSLRIDVAQRSAAEGQRAGLVEHDVGHARQRLERIGAHAIRHCRRRRARRWPRRARRRRERQRARTGDDEHREGHRERARRIDGRPRDRRRGGQREQRADEPARRRDRRVARRAGRSAAARSTSRSHRREPRRLARGADAHDERAVARPTRPRAPVVAGVAPRGRDLAGQHRLLDARAPSTIVAVGGERSRPAAPAPRSPAASVAARRSRRRGRQASASSRSAVSGAPRATALDAHRPRGAARASST